MRPSSRMPPRVTLHLLRRHPEVRALPRPEAFARALARAGANAGEVNLILAGADLVRRLNREFRGKDRDTDVLAFDYREPAGAGPRPTRGTPDAGIWGDVFVSAEAAAAQAGERDIPVREETARLFLHGCLHLLGYRDGTPAQRKRLEAVQEILLPQVLRTGPPRTRRR
jgi:probable rRNA maturation factor